MALITERLSTKVEAGFSAVVGSSTEIVTLATGIEHRNARWSQKRRRYTSRYASFDKADRDELLDVAHAANGMLNTFLFRDPSDYAATGHSQGNAPSGTTAIQLVKLYTRGSVTHTRTITKPKAGTVTVYQSGVAKAGSVDTTTGLFTPDLAWTEGEPLTADFQFDVPVRFASDDIEFILPHYDIATVVVDLIEVFGE